MHETDILNLPDVTKKYINRLLVLGFNRERIFGLFVLLGFYAGAPRSQEKITELFSCLDLMFPNDRTKNLDEVVGHLFSNYDREINEFFYRSGYVLDLREIKVPKVEKSFYIVNPNNEGLLSTNINSIQKLSDASRLCDAFINALGKRAIESEANLLEAYQCGIFQIQLHALSDVNGAAQIAKVIGSVLPPFLSKCFFAATTAQVDYFIGMEVGQIALVSLMQSMEKNYVQQMWAFQSSLFFKNGETLADVDKLSNHKWFEWVLQNAVEFDEKYSSQILPLSSSNIALSDLPAWNQTIRTFEACDSYIEQVWGFAAAKLENNFESLEYRALLVHVLYSSLTASKEIVH